MKDLLKRTILKTLREFDKLEVFPTIDDVYYSLDTSELKKAFKRDIFDEAIEDLLQDREIFISRADDLFFVSLQDINSVHAKEILEYRKVYRKEIKNIAKKLEIFKKFPFLLNISTFNLVPFKEHNRDQIYLFVKNNSKRIMWFLLKVRFFLSKKRLPRITIVEHQDLKSIFPERQIQSAYKMANLHAIFNKNNFYENFLYKNKWVFEILGNFPVSRISLNYRGTSKEANFDSSFITKILNKIFR